MNGLLEVSVIDENEEGALTKDASEGKNLRIFYIFFLYCYFFYLSSNYTFRCRKRCARILARCDENKRNIEPGGNFVATSIYKLSLRYFLTWPFSVLRSRSMMKELWSFSRISNGAESVIPRGLSLSLFLIEILTLRTLSWQKHITWLMMVMNKFWSKP